MELALAKGAVLFYGSLNVLALGVTICYMISRALFVGVHVFIELHVLLFGLALIVAVSGDLYSWFRCSDCLSLTGMSIRDLLRLSWFVLVWFFLIHFVDLFLPSLLQKLILYTWTSYIRSTNPTICPRLILYVVASVPCKHAGYTFLVVVENIKVAFAYLSAT